MKIRHVLIRVIPFLFLFSLIFFIAMLLILQRQERKFQQAIQWTTYPLGDHASLGGGDVLIADDAERIWVAGGDSLHGFLAADGTQRIRHAGHYSDLAISQQGQLLAVLSYAPTENSANVNTLHVFDGQEWKIYHGPASVKHTTLPTQRILQVEVDSNGRIWVVLGDAQDASIAEMLIDPDEATAVFSPQILTITSGTIKSLDADTQGSIWVAIWRYDTTDPSDGWSSGLYVFSGENWERISGRNRDLQNVVQTTFDKQGHAWVLTACGSVMTYDGRNWDTVITGNINRYCDRITQTSSLIGITLDNQDSVWIWNVESVKFGNDGNWVTFIPEDLGLIEGGVVAAVMTDNLDQVWIATSGGVSVSSIEAVQPLPQEMISQHKLIVALKDWTLTKIWLTPFFLALLWLALRFSLPRSVVLALSIGLVVSFFVGSPTIRYSYPDPLLVAIAFGIIGGLVGGLIYPRSDIQKRFPWDIMITIFAFLAGLFFYVSVLFISLHP